MAVKIFSGHWQNVEKEVNFWMNGRKFYQAPHILQSGTGSYITISIFYME